MPRNQSKLVSPRAGRFLRVGQDLITIALDDRVWWRLLVPVADNDGLVFTDRHHLKLYRLVFKISGGSTDNPWSNGRWMDNGLVYKDRVVPLEFLATTEEADKIAAFALIHYDQIEILCVPISDRVRRYRRATTESHNQRKERGSVHAPVVHVHKQNGTVPGELTNSVTGSGEPSETRVPPLAKAARPSSEGPGSPDSDDEVSKQ